MYNEVRLFFAVSFLEVAVGFDVLEAYFAYQPTRVVLAQREHVEMIDRTIGELVAEVCQPLVDVFGFGLYVLAAIIVGVLWRRNPGR